MSGCPVPGYPFFLAARSSMDRATDFGSVGWGFESLRAGHYLPLSFDQASLRLTSASISAASSWAETSPSKILPALPLAGSINFRCPGRAQAK